MSETNTKAPNGNQPRPDAAKPAGTKTDDKQNPANSPGEMEDRLDEALDETFPSSDPVSVKITK